MASDGTSAAPQAPGEKPSDKDKKPEAQQKGPSDVASQSKQTRQRSSASKEKGQDDVLSTTTAWGNVQEHSTVQATVMAASGSTLWTFLAVLGKTQQKGVHTAKLLFFVSVGIFVGVLTCMAGVQRPRSPPRTTLTLLLRSAMGAAALFARFLSLRQLSLVDSAVLTSTAPALSLLPELLLALIGRKRSSFVALAPPALFMTSALLLVLLPSGAPEDPLEDEDKAKSDILSTRSGALWALACALLQAAQQHLSDITLGIPQAVVLLHTSFALFLGSAILSACFLDEPEQLFTQGDMGAMAVVSQISFAYVYFVSKARELDEGALVNMYKYSFDVVCACALAPLSLHELPVLRSYAAAVLVIFAVILAELHHLVATMPAFRKKLRYFM
ncbi:uncharacterized protein LOC135399802 [Ornithodoros turicata]|uniref:uncharacterized protein LOC135399802 n=1 Tax=Ornithodoros turicata TaxID=34597 RepID=UPI003139A5F9